MQRWEEYSVSVHQRVVDDIPFFARHQFLPLRPVLLRVMLSTVPTIPHAQKTWVLGEARLLSQQKIHHLQVNTNKPLMLIITNFLQHILHYFILLLQCSRVSDATEANWLPLCSRTYFSGHLLLSMNNLQSLGSYCGTPSLSRSCAISAQYTKAFTVEKKWRYS